MFFVRFYDVNVGGQWLGGQELWVEYERMVEVINVFDIFFCGYIFCYKCIRSYVILNCWFVWECLVCFKEFDFVSLLEVIGGYVWEVEDEIQYIKLMFNYDQMVQKLGSVDYFLRRLKDEKVEVKFVGLFYIMCFCSLCGENYGMFYVMQEYNQLCV